MPKTVDHTAELKRLMEGIWSEGESGEPPFRCHKGHFPGPPCNEPVRLQSTPDGACLYHGNHTWESVLVSKEFSQFLVKYVPAVVSAPPRPLASPDLVDDFEVLVSVCKKGNYPLLCHKNSAPRCREPATMHRTDGRIALYHGKHDWEAVFVSDAVAALIQLLLSS
jgi:hypothetical protein